MTDVLIDGRSVDADISGTAGTSAGKLAADLFGAEAVEGATFSFKVDGEVIPPANIVPSGEVVELVEVTEHIFVSLEDSGALVEGDGTGDALPPIEDPATERTAPSRRGGRSAADDQPDGS